MGKVRDMAQKLQLSLKRVLPKSRAWFSHVFRRSPEPARHVAVHEGHMAQLRERPEWQADKDAPICTRCRAEFTFFFRKHHCRHCGAVFCSECCSEWLALPELGYTDPVRVCKECHNQEAAAHPENPRSLFAPIEDRLAVLGSADDNAIRERGPRKKLTVKVYEAQNIMGGAKRNPYFIIKVQGFEERSKVVPDTLAPKWDERIVFEKLLTLTSAIGVEIELWDKAMWKKDEYLGGALVTLDRTNGMVQDGVLTAAFVEGWYPLRPRQNKEEAIRGEIHVKLTYH